MIVTNKTKWLQSFVSGKAIKLCISKLLTDLRSIWKTTTPNTSLIYDHTRLYQFVREDIHCHFGNMTTVSIIHWWTDTELTHKEHGGNYYGKDNSSNDLEYFRRRHFCMFKETNNEIIYGKW